MADEQEDYVNTARSGYDNQSSIVWVFVAILVYLSDFFLTHFKGIDAKQFWMAIKITGIEGLTRKGSFLGIAILLFIVWHFLGRPLSREEIISRIPLILLITSLFTFGYLFDLGVIMHIFMAGAILFFLMYKREEDKTRANYLMLAFIFIDFFLFSIFQLNKLIIPVWVIAALMFTNRSKAKSIIAWFLFLVYFFHFFSVVTVFDFGPQHLNGKDFQDFIEFKNQVWSNAKTFAKSIITGAERQKNITQAMVFGDYYTSQVDQNVQQQLGVSIIEIKSTDSEVYEDEPLTIYARVKVRTIKEDIILRSFCRAESLLPDAINPAIKNISQYEDMTIDCIFNKCRLSPGSKTIYFNMAFNFQTLSYLRNYFIDRERMMAMIREDPAITTSQDILQNLGISDTSPIALSTSGPAKIGIELEKTQPVGVDRNLPSVSFRLGITLENIWEGEIKDIKDLTIILPNEMSIERDSFSDNTSCGGYVFEKKTCADVFQEEGEEKDWCDDAESNIYRINQDGNNQRIIPAGQKGIKLYKSLVCRVSIDNSQYNNFLGNAPISTKNFKVISDYDYEITRSLSVNIKKSPYDGCKEVKTEEAIKQQECPAYIAEKNNLPDKDHLERYVSYQSSVTGAIKSNRPASLNIVETEALIAAVMSQASNLGDTDENQNNIPDFIAGYGIKFPDIFKDNPISNIQEAAKFLKAAMDKETGTKQEKVAKTLVKYASNNGLEKDFTAGAAAYFTKWQNMLCKGEETAETEEEKEEVIGTGLFKKNDLIGIDTNDDLTWTNDDQYYFIKSSQSGPQGAVYLLSDSKQPLRDQMIITRFDTDRNSDSGKHNVMIRRPGQEPADWNAFIFSPNLKLKSGVIS
ncbi:MAG: hypothetical protein U9R34_06060 [Nanoarchaeota archaeon]|nr:hypothetical protein [Nanoarchaeota archaeon]